ncbi:calcium sensor EFh [Kibdelosporangium aridum]|uniref:Calcium sensor EFh n=1 Tax=Kibdelosporangium aridum TaxID=2030 RepID=A0A428ZRF5_KIBAR|nr:EF-hand domain-containing protein [Kibdelosporangium aridum]RSM90649.1 calcium sensor EFh [Kibdelosporangium aridum]
MASDLQRRKVKSVFTAMDVDGDGFLEERDFQALADRWTALRSGDAGLLSQIMLGWWQTLLSASDADRDEKVTLDEVLLVVDQLPDMPDAVVGTAAAMFEAIDADRDGYVSASEYRQMIEAWNGKATDTDSIFPALDTDGDGRLSRAEFSTLWFEFWAGDNADAPGTLVFGPLAA